MRHLFDHVSFCYLWLAPEWKIHRKLLRGTFSQEILNSFVKTYVVYSNIMVGKLEESLGKGLVDVFPFFSLCMTDILCGKNENGNRNVINRCILDTMMGVQVNTMKENGYNLILQTARYFFYCGSEQLCSTIMVFQTRRARLFAYGQSFASSRHFVESNFSVQRNTYNTGRGSTIY